MSIKLALSEHFIQRRRGKKAPTVFLEPHPADKSFKVTLLMHNSGIFLFFFYFFVSFHFISFHFCNRGNETTHFELGHDNNRQIQFKHDFKVSANEL